MWSKPHPSLWGRHYLEKTNYSILIGILLLATILRLTGLSEPGLWLDEISYTTAAQKPISNQIFNATDTLGGYLSVDPTLSAIPFSLSLMLGHANFFVRWPAAFFGILSVAAIYTLGRRIFGFRVGVVAALLLSVSDFHVLYSQEGRSYTQFVFFCIISFLFFFLASKNPYRKQYWVFYILSTWAGVSTNHLMLFAIAAQAIFLGLLYVERIIDHGPGTDRVRLSFRSVLVFTISVVVVYLLRLPWFEDFTQRQCAGCSIGHPAYPLDFWSSLATLIETLTHQSTIATAILLILTLSGVIWSVRHSIEGGLLLVCWAAGSLLITTTGLWFIAQFFHVRYTIWGLPAVLLLISCGVVGIATFIGDLLINSKTDTKWPKTILQSIVMSVILLPILASNLVQLQTIDQFKQNWPLGRIQEAATLLTTQAQSGDAIIAVGLPARHLEFFIEPLRQDLIFFDETTFKENVGAQNLLPKTLAGRWYILHNSYRRPNVPAQWAGRLDYHDFNDVLLVHLPNDCTLPDCIKETKTLLQEVSEVNPGTTLAARAGNVVLGFDIMQIQ